MAKYQVFSENEWIYPDTEIGCENKAELYAARNGDVCFQILTDYELKGNEKIETEFLLDGCTAEVMQLLKAKVTKNSAPDFEATDDYSLVKDFVTRKAPFEIYDVTKPINEGATVAQRAAFFIRINVDKNAPVGIFETTLKINFDSIQIEIPVSIKIHSVTIPSLHDAAFHMTNWIHFNDGYKKLRFLSTLYDVEEYSEEYYKILENTMLNLVDMRNDVLMLPKAKTICDNDGKIIGFDFTQVERTAKLALKCGFKYIMGGFVARWIKWDDSELYLLWGDFKTGVTTLEGFRQLKLYFEGVKKMIKDNGFDDCYWQCLVDEPQIPNALAYRALSGICRQILPGITINDPIEAVDIEGAVDIWVVKQAIYDKYIDQFRKLQDLGEQMWIYTCGYPAGKTMNRVMDLPLTASRLPMWMCYGYDAPGFLHFGYFLLNEDQYDVNFVAPRGRIFPAGNAHIVYKGPNGPWYSVRGHLQRLGAQDFELLNILGNRNKEKAKTLVNKLCRNFDDYESDANIFDSVRKQLLEELG